jgi:hypothetical protein
LSSLLRMLTFVTCVLPIRFRRRLLRLAAAGADVRDVRFTDPL